MTKKKAPGKGKAKKRPPEKPQGATNRHRKDLPAIPQDVLNKLDHAGISQKDIARFFNRDPAQISRLLSDVNRQGRELTDYKENKVNIFETIEAKIASIVMSAEVRVENAQDLRAAMTALGIAVDKTHLIQGKPTAIVDITRYEGQSKRLRDLASEITELEQGADGTFQVPDSKGPPQHVVSEGSDNKSSENNR